MLPPTPEMAAGDWERDIETHGALSDWGPDRDCGNVILVVPVVVGADACGSGLDAQMVVDRANECRWRASGMLVEDLDRYWGRSACAA